MRAAKFKVWAENEGFFTHPAGATLDPQLPGRSGNPDEPPDDGDVLRIDILKPRFQFLEAIVNEVIG